MNAATPEAAVLADAAPTAAERSRRRAEVVAALSAALPAHALLWQREDTVPYECDGLTAYREQPLVVALPESEAQVAAVLAICHRLAVPVVARGAEGGDDLGLAARAFGRNRRGVGENGGFGHGGVHRRERNEAGGLARSWRRGAASWPPSAAPAPCRHRRRRPRARPRRRRWPP